MGGGREGHDIACPSFVTPGKAAARLPQSKTRCRPEGRRYEVGYSFSVPIGLGYVEIKPGFLALLGMTGTVGQKHQDANDAGFGKKPQPKEDPPLRARKTRV